MKKVLLFALLLACLLAFAGCDPGINRLDDEVTLSNIEKIELFQYENTNPRHVRTKKSVFDFSKATLIATLDEACIEDVVEEIAHHEMFVYGRTLNEPIGKTLILYQKDGSMIVLSGCVYESKIGLPLYYGVCNVYDENGVFLEYLGDIDSDMVEALASKYFEITP